MSSYLKKKYISENGHTPQVNVLVGSLTYSAFLGLFVFVAYEIWGFQAFDEQWLALMGVLAFACVKPFLKDVVGFWIY